MQNNNEYARLIKSSVSLAYQWKRHEHLRPSLAKYGQNLAVNLAEQWAVFTLLICAFLPAELNPEPAQQHCGYIIIKIGKAKVYIPYFFAESFPQNELLHNILTIVERLKLFQHGTCCISGSVCHSRNELPVGDLDFCEYLPTVESASTQQLIGKIKGADDDLVCYELRIDDNHWTRPLPPDFERQILDIDPLKTDTPHRRMLHLVANLPNTGVVEVTKLLLLEETREFDRSTPFQEAPISTPPRGLCSPLDLGNYLIWLREETKTLWADNNPLKAIKALKRALCITRVLHLKETTDGLHHLLADSESARLAALHSRCKLYKKLADIEDAKIQALINPLKATITNLRYGDSTEDNSYHALTTDELLALQRFKTSAEPIFKDILKLFDQYYWE